MADNKKPDEKKIDKKEELNIFILNSIYPDAESIFKFNLESLDKIKDSCYVVLDTNALLVPYTISKDSLEQIKGIYKKLIDTSRLVIPGQVAREFAKNRSQKITELYDHLSKKRDGVKFDNIGTYPLLESFQGYKDLIEVGKQINELIESYRKQIRKITDLISGWCWDDPVSLMYRELFSDKVVLDLALDEPKQEEITKDLSRRQLYSIPPGYKDAGKPDNGIGDLINWHTILHIGKTHKKHVCFVSGDAKADWYNKSNNHPLYPRYELVDEFRRCSDGQSFNMCSFSKFLEIFGASEPTVKEVKVEESHQIKNEVSSILYNRSFVQKAVHNWLINEHKRTIAEIEVNNASFPDFIIKDVFDESVKGVEVKFLFDYSSVHLISNVINQFNSDNAIGEGMVIIILEDTLDALSIRDTLQKLIKLAEKSMEFVIGVVSVEDGFKEIARHSITII